MKRLTVIFTPLIVVAILAAFMSPAEDKDARTVVIESVGNELKFAQVEFTVKPDEKIRLVFENKATVQGISHNVVILEAGEGAKGIDRVGVAAISAADNDYIPDDDAILFYTPMAAPGDTVEVTFEAPTEPGKYPYLCSFPGHYVLMRGIMIVEE